MELVRSEESKEVKHTGIGRVIHRDLETMEDDSRTCCS